MFVSLNQIYIFLFSVSIGAICGVIYSPLSMLKSFIKLKAVKSILDFLFFVLLSFIYIHLTFIYHFPSIRAYMIIGFFAGFILYIKSFHFFVAKYVFMAYNKIKKNKGENSHGGRKV